MKHLSAVLFLATAVATTGCSVNRALNKPSPKDLSFLTRGASRDAVRSELGDFTVSADTTQCDIHSYTEGSGGGKYVRAFFYSILDLGSAGVFEIFLNPIETAIGNDKVRTKACYNDKNLLVKANEFHKGGRETRLTLTPADDPALEASLDTPTPTPVAPVAPAVVVAPVAVVVAEPVAIAAPAALAESVPAAVVTAPEAVVADSAVQPALPVAAAAVTNEESVVVAPVDAVPAQAASTEAAPVESVSAEAVSAVAAPVADLKPAAMVKKAKSRKPSVKRKS